MQINPENHISFFKLFTISTCSRQTDRRGNSEVRSELNQVQGFGLENGLFRFCMPPGMFGLPGLAIQFCCYWHKPKDGPSVHHQVNEPDGHRNGKSPEQGGKKHKPDYPLFAFTKRNGQQRAHNGRKNDRCQKGQALQAIAQPEFYNLSVAGRK